MPPKKTTAAAKAAPKVAAKPAAKPAAKASGTKRKAEDDDVDEAPKAKRGRPAAATTKKAPAKRAATTKAPRKTAAGELNYLVSWSTPAYTALTSGRVARARSSRAL